MERRRGTQAHPRALPPSGLAVSSPPPHRTFYPMRMTSSYKGLSQEGSLPEHPAFRREAHQHLADRLEMDRPALALLGPRVDVAHPAFERIAFEDRARPGRMVQRRDDIARLVDRPGRRQPQLRVMLGADPAVALRLVPHLADHAAQIGARRFEPRLRLRDLG